MYARPADCIACGSQGLESDSRRVEEILKEVGLGSPDDANKITKLLSGGQKRRLGLALAYVGDPYLVVLDEPANGVDPEGRVEFHKIIHSRKNNRVTLLTTHQMEEVDSLYSLTHLSLTLSLTHSSLPGTSPGPRTMQKITRRLDVLTLPSPSLPQPYYSLP